MPVTRHLKQPTRMIARKTGLRTGCPCADHPYLVLLPMGFTMPPLLPAARCALTAPFHPYPETGRFTFCGTFPGVTPAGH